MLLHDTAHTKHQDAKREGAALGTNIADIETARRICRSYRPREAFVTIGHNPSSLVTLGCASECSPSTSLRSRRRHPLQIIYMPFTDAQLAEARARAIAAAERRPASPTMSTPRGHPVLSVITGAAAAEEAHSVIAPRAPNVPEENKAALLCLAEDSLNLLLDDIDGRAEGHEGRTTCITIVESKEEETSSSIGPHGVVERVFEQTKFADAVSFDAISHTVLPWQQPPKAMAGQLLQTLYALPNWLTSLRNRSSAAASSVGRDLGAAADAAESVRAYQLEAGEHARAAVLGARLKDEYASDEVKAEAEAEAEEAAAEERLLDPKVVVARANYGEKLAAADYAVALCLRESLEPIRAELAAADEAFRRTSAMKLLEERFGHALNGCEEVRALEAVDRPLRVAERHEEREFEGALYALRAAEGAVLSLHAVVASVWVEAVAADAIRSARAGGLRWYGAGQPLVVRHEAIGWVEAEAVAAEADGRHWLHIPSWGSEVFLLHPWNHAPYELSMDSYDRLRRHHTHATALLHRTTRDPLTGRAWDVLEHCVSVGLEGRANADASTADTPAVRAADDDAMMSVCGGAVDAPSLLQWVHTLYHERCHKASREAIVSTHGTCVLLTGVSTSGRSTLLRQLAVLLSTQWAARDEEERYAGSSARRPDGTGRGELLVPILIRCGMSLSSTLPHFP